MNHWAYQWKIFVNSDTSKEGKEIAFFSLKNITTYGTVFFDNLENFL